MHHPVLIAMLLLACWMNTAPARAQTAAGTPIDNVATVRYLFVDATVQTRSNPDRLITAERLDVMLAVGASTPGANGRTLYVVIVTNPGNGTEAYDIVARATDTSISRIVIDADGDGRVGGGDTPLDARTPPLVSGGVLRLLVEADATGPSPDILFTSRAATGSGAPGLTFDGRGDGGGDAVVGRTGASATVSLSGTGATPPTLVKTQAVRAPDGSARPVAGAIITYTLEARFVAPARDVRINDDIPQGTRFSPGSLTLDGVALTDVADADAGTATPTAVTVVLPGPPAGARHVIQFQTVIE